MKYYNKYEYLYNNLNILILIYFYFLIYANTKVILYEKDLL